MVDENSSSSRIELDEQVRGAVGALWDASGRAGTLRDFTLDVRMPDGGVRPTRVQIDGIGLEERIVLEFDGRWADVREIVQESEWRWKLRLAGGMLTCDGDKVTLSNR